MDARLRSLLHNALINALQALIALGLLAIGLESLLELPKNYTIQALAVFVAFLAALSPFLPNHLPLDRFGGANQVTLARVGIVALISGLIGGSSLNATQGWFTAILAGLALLLDGVDGWLARRHGMVSAFGARFDMETDALLILVMALLLYQSSKAGVWVLLSGLMRYGFVALGLLWPWLNQSLPPSKRRQTICVIQSIALAVCLTPVVVPPYSWLAAASALLLLIISFAIDIVWLARHARLQQNTL